MEYNLFLAFYKQYIMNCTIIIITSVLYTVHKNMFNIRSVTLWIFYSNFYEILRFIQFDAKYNYVTQKYKFINGVGIFLVHEKNEHRSGVMYQHQII